MLLPKIMSPADVHMLDALLACTEVDFDLPLGQIAIYLGMYVHFSEVHRRALSWDPWANAEAGQPPDATLALPAAPSCPPTA